MMTCTQHCGQWAQWRVTAPVLDDEGNLIKLLTVGAVCGQHKNEMQAAAAKNPSPTDFLFSFVGAIPDGAYRPES